MPRHRDQEPLLPPQDQLWRSMGLGRAKLRVIYGVMAVMAVAIILQGVERWHNAKTLGTQVYVVVSDPQGNVAQIARANAAWQPGDGVWINAAQQWLRNVRAQPLDPDTWRWQATQIRNTTNRELWYGINDWINRTRKEFRDRAIEVEILEATLVGTPRANGATVYLRWRERARSRGATAGDWSSFAATISLAKLAPKDAKEVADNPTGIFVIDYSFQGQIDVPAPAEQKKAEVQ